MRPINSLSIFFFVSAISIQILIDVYSYNKWIFISLRFPRKFEYIKNRLIF